MNVISMNTEPNCFDLGPGFDSLETIFMIIIQFIIRDPDGFINEINKNGKLIIQNFLDYIPKLFYFAKSTENEPLFLLLVKSLITVVETFYLSNYFNQYLPDILNIAINEIKEAKIISYKSFLLQLVSIKKIQLF